MEEVRSGRQPFVKLDILHRRHSAFADQLGPAQVVAQSLVERLSVLAVA